MHDRQTGVLPTGAGIDSDQIAQLLAFGFVPDNEDPLSLLAQWTRPPTRSHNTRTAALVTEGVAALHSAVDQSLALGGGDHHVVLLSGGLDSRAILGGLLRSVDRSQITAATFGVPGDQDFDFAAAVARRAGVRHVTLESFSVDWSTPGLVDSILARGVPSPAPFGQRYLSYVLHERIGRDHVFWDGLCGDAVAGKRLPAASEQLDWGSQIEWFVRFHLVPGWRRLVPPGFDPRAAMPTMPFCPPGQLTYFDQLILGVRQRCRIATRILTGYTVRTPFLNRAWLDFMLAVPPHHRYDRTLYVQILKTAFPELFSLPTTALDGLAVTAPTWAVLARRLGRGVRAGTAPRATGRANDAVRSRLRTPGPIHDLARENLADLADRGVLDWLDVRSYLPGTTADAAADDALVTRLLDLELNLKAADRLACQQTA